MTIKELVHSRTGAVIAGATVLVTLGGVGGAIAAGQINSRDIKNGSVRSVDVKNDTLRGVDVKNGSIGMRDLNGFTKNQVRDGSSGERGPRGPRGPEGAQGPAGPQGPAGSSGTAKYVGPNWSIVDRNVIGNGDAYLRSGPSSENFGVSVKPPLGIGSLGLRTGSGDDKVVFGNQVDFVGDLVANLSTLKYSIYTTGENGEGNLPNLQFEIDPNLSTTPSNYSTLGFVPKAVPANKWTEVDAASAASGAWFMTGAAGTATGCTMSAPCTWAEVKTKLSDGGDDASIWTVQFNKGRDSAFVGAVDKLVINTTTYDFEPFGVTAN